MTDQTPDNSCPASAPRADDNIGEPALQPQQPFPLVPADDAREQAFDRELDKESEESARILERRRNNQRAAALYEEEINRINFVLAAEGFTQAQINASYGAIGSNNALRLEILGKARALGWKSPLADHNFGAADVLVSTHPMFKAAVSGGAAPLQQEQATGQTAEAAQQQEPAQTAEAAPTPSTLHTYESDPEEVSDRPNSWPRKAARLADSGRAPETRAETLRDLGLVLAQLDPAAHLLFLQAVGRALGRDMLCDLVEAWPQKPEAAAAE